MPRTADPAPSRQMVALRPQPELRAQLEAAAQETGRPISKEAEWRLAQSFVSASDPLPGVFSDETRRFLRGQRDVARFLETLADTFMHTIRAANERDRDEIEVRTALRAAVDVAVHRHLWRGEAEPQVEGPAPAPGTRPLDLPPAILGYKIANDRLAWLDAFREEGASVDTLEGRITNAFSGDGRTTVFGPTPEESATEKARVRKVVADHPGEFVDPSELSKFKQAVETYSVKDDDEPPRRSLKDIMGR